MKAALMGWLSKLKTLTGVNSKSSMGLLGYFKRKRDHEMVGSAYQGWLMKCTLFDEGGGTWYSFAHKTANVLISLVTDDEEEILNPRTFRLR